MNNLITQVDQNVSFRKFFWQFDDFRLKNPVIENLYSGHVLPLSQYASEGPKPPSPDRKSGMNT